MSDKSTRKSPRSKSTAIRPKKPYPDFPLTPHASGKWMKKIRGKIVYFGRWGRVVNGKMERLPDEENAWWQPALDLYKAQAEDLHAGRVPSITDPGKAVTIKDVCNAFLNSKLQKLNAKRLSPRSFIEYRATTDRLIAAFGKNRHVDSLRPIDFERLQADMSKKFGLHRLSGEIVRVKSVFKYAAAIEVIEKAPKYGSEFKRPDKAELRKHRASNGKKLFAAEEVRKLIDSAGIPLKAMILVGINCGFGNNDCSSLPVSAVDLEGGWLDFERPKTGIARRAKLWPETVNALQDAINERPTPKNATDANLVFITKYGHRWVRTVLKEVSEGIPAHSTVDAVSLEFGKLARKLMLPQSSFYVLRHTFRTVADAVKDLVAVRLVMGHADHGIDDVYREGIDDDRLVAVSEHVRKWLPPSPSPENKTEGGAA